MSAWYGIGVILGLPFFHLSDCPGNFWFPRAPLFSPQPIIWGLTFSVHLHASTYCICIWSQTEARERETENIGRSHPLGTIVPLIKQKDFPPLGFELLWAHTANIATWFLGDSGLRIGEKGGGKGISVFSLSVRSSFPNPQDRTRRLLEFSLPALLCPLLCFGMPWDQARRKKW